jgi:hypothetical protein
MRRYSRLVARGARGEHRETCADRLSYLACTSRLSGRSSRPGLNCKGDDDVDAKRSRPSIGKPAMCHARKERAVMIGTDQRITSGPAARTAASRGRIHGCTRIVSRKVRFFSLAPRAPSIHGRYCCKSPKLPGDNFPAIRRYDRRQPICVASITLPRSPVSLSSSDDPPHLFTKVASTARRIFSHQSKKTFATQSARRRHADVKCPRCAQIQQQKPQDIARGFVEWCS